jgi:subtilisin family serine protease
MPERSQRRYVLLPERGAVAATAPESRLLGSLPRVHSTEGPASVSLEAAEGHDVQVVDSTVEDGPHLVEASAETAEALNSGDAPLRLLPEIEYPPPNPPLQAFAGATPAGGHTAASIVVVDAETDIGIAGANVVAFTDFANGEGAEGVSDAAGEVKLSLPTTSIERLFVYPPLSGYWGEYQQGVTLAGTVKIPLAPIDLSVPDCVRHYYGASKFDAALGVQVGVIDTGAGPHADLNLLSGVNTVTGEPKGEWTDAHGHGTHVSGLIGSNGVPPTGLRGVAPGIALRAYRVFPAGKGGATNYSILKAMILAANDGCDIVNLSLGGGPADHVVQEAVVDARNAGMVVMVAAGNDSRSAVNFPAAYPLATAVSAMGREGTFPAGSLPQADVLRPPSGGDLAEFIAEFSNIGPQIVTTAPGVGCLSTIPGDRFGPMSGTSMASPVATGAVACLLSQNPKVFGMNRDATRSGAIAALLTDNCSARGFGPEFEGSGMPDPAIV